MAGYLIGLDYGTESARGVLVDVRDGRIVGSATQAYRHGVMAQALPDGTPLPRHWALQDADDYLEAAGHILAELGRGREIAGIGLGFTASSPLPVTARGEPLSRRYPGRPHAYVKLWKHASAQPWADRMNARGGDYLANNGGKLSGEWLLAKAGQLADEAPDLWNEAERFVEAGDWLVWQLTGIEARSMGFAAYKAQYDEVRGYPADVVPGLAQRLCNPLPIGSSAGELSGAWRERTGISGPAIVAVAVIDSHLILPAVGATRPGTLAAALGTSAVYLCLSDEFRPLPKGIEGTAKDGSVRGLWCYEAGQAGFGDTLSWFLGIAPRATDIGGNFRWYNAQAAGLQPGAGGLVALDWWNGNRVPHADSTLTGLLLGLTRQTTSEEIYLSLLESICFGARSIVDLFSQARFPLDRIIMSSGLAQNNPLLIQIMSDVLNRQIEVPVIEHPTAVGAAIHGAVAARVVAGYDEGAARFGAQRFVRYAPRQSFPDRYNALYAVYAALAAGQEVPKAMHALHACSTGQ
jgi:L-ribulokinase